MARVAQQNPQVIKVFPAYLRETIEAIGWRLEYVSHVWSTAGGNHAVGYYVFRRASTT